MLEPQYEDESLPENKRNFRLGRRWDREDEKLQPWCQMRRGVCGEQEEVNDLM